MTPPPQRTALDRIGVRSISHQAITTKERAVIPTIDPWFYCIRILLQAFKPFRMLGSTFAAAAIGYDRLLHRDN